MRILLLVFSFIAAHGASAQSDFIKPGDSIVLGTPADSLFKHAFLVTKTRISPTVIAYDTATGKGFHNAFFSLGDFNMGNLAPTYAGQILPVIAMEYLSTKDGKGRYVVFLDIPLENSLIWLDIEDAAETGEVLVIEE